MNFTRKQRLDLGYVLLVISAIVTTVVMIAAFIKTNSILNTVNPHGDWGNYNKTFRLIQSFDPSFYKQDLIDFKNNAVNVAHAINAGTKPFVISFAFMILTVCAVDMIDGHYGRDSSVAHSFKVKTAKYRLITKVAFSLHLLLYVPISVGGIFNACMGMSAHNVITTETNNYKVETYKLSFLEHSEYVTKISKNVAKPSDWQAKYKFVDKIITNKKPDINQAKINSLK